LALVRRRAPSWGMHINVFDYTKGKGDKAIKEIIPFNRNKDDLIHMDSLYIGMVKII
jgi:hypothetical protein